MTEIRYCSCCEDEPVWDEDEFCPACIEFLWNGSD